MASPTQQHQHTHSHAPRKHAHGRTPSTVPTLVTPVPPLTSQHAHNHSHAHAHMHAHDHDHDHGHSSRARSHSHRRTNSGPLPLASIFSLHLLPTHMRPQLLFAIGHLTLGAALWVSGQARDSLAVTGLGYLVVFDALGVLNPVAAAWMNGFEGARRTKKAEEKAMSRPYGGTSSGKEGDVRRPYGAHRTSTLLHFTQAIYLLFSALYVCKESVEHALLHSAATVVPDETTPQAHPDLIHAGEYDHTKSVGIGGEHVHEESLAGIELPIGLLIAATLTCLYANVRLGNHARLMAACGMSTTTSSATSSLASAAHNRRRSVLFDPALQATRGASALLTTLLSNPFSLTVLFFSGSLTFASLAMPKIQVAALDKVLAGLESVSMGWLAWPASMALGKVLLQTAPDRDINEQRQRIELALKEIETHPLVVYVAPPHLWQLTPPTSSQIMLESTAARHMHSASVAVSPLGRGGRSRGGSVENGGVGSGLSGLVGGAFGMVQMQARTAPLILTVEIFLDRNRAKAGDCLEVTRWAYDLLAPCVGAAWGVEVGAVGRGGVRAGEVVVKVRRDGKEQDEIEEEERQAHAHEHSCGGHGHGHDHDHHHGHAHDHSHDHGHGHGHGHQHDHSSHAHGHGHSHGHDHSSHDHVHSHAHGHGHGHDHASHDHGNAAGHTHAHSHEPTHAYSHNLERSHSHAHGHGHDHAHAHGHEHGHGHDHAHGHTHEHSAGHGHVHGTGHGHDAQSHPHSAAHAHSHA